MTSCRRDVLEHIVRQCAAGVHVPGVGYTRERFEVLADCAASDLAAARLVEGHLDAKAILAEGGHLAPEDSTLYGVWAARPPSRGLTASRTPHGWHLTGSKPFCSGAGLLDRALVTAESAQGYLLFDIDVSLQVTEIDAGSWPAVGMAASESHTVHFGGPPLPDSARVGESGFYLQRPGFWFGAMGVAACWYGGARGLLTHTLKALGGEVGDAEKGELGRATGEVLAMRWLLERAADRIDADPGDLLGTAHVDALTLRQAVHRGATAVLSHVAAAAGARPLCHDRRQSQRAADLYVYLAQHHGPRDAALLGQVALTAGGSCL